jgi:hypothetical protein
MDAPATVASVRSLLEERRGEEGRKKERLEVDGRGHRLFSREENTSLSTPWNASSTSTTLDIR